MKKEVKSTKRVISSNITESAAVRERRAEIKALKDQIQFILVSREKHIDKKEETLAKNRINELINTKKVLAEIDTKPFVRN